MDATTGNLNERPILITGCSSGIGRCTALGLKARGYRVFASARKTADVQALEAAGFETLKLDLADTDSITRAVADLLAATGGAIYGLFNNGAYGQPGAVEDLSRAALREQFETNLFGTHELTCQLIPTMRRQGCGRIIQNSSILGLVALRYRGAYNASKFALEGLSDTLRLELRGSGIHVSLIEPGPITSRFSDNAYAAFTRNVDASSSVHRPTYDAMVQRLNNSDKPTPFTLPPEAVLDKVVHALESKKPRAHYYVTKPTWLLTTLKRLLPTSVLDGIVNRVP